MSNVPPVIAPPALPPPLPASVTEQSLQKYIARCKVLRIVAASLFLVGVAGLAQSAQFLAFWDWVGSTKHAPY